MIRNYFSLIKFSHTVFALPFAIVGFFLAVWHEHYSFSLKIFLLVIASMITARSAAMAFNRVVDARYDKINSRTSAREIPAGIISSRSVILFVLLCCVAFVMCTFFINRLCFFLSPLALSVVLGYSYAKRFTHFSHFILGIGLSLAPVGSYLAVTGSFSSLPLLLGAAVLCWVSGFDIIYALQDQEFDKQAHLHSIPVLFGNKNALLFSSLLHFLCAALLVLVGMIGGFGIWYWAGAVIFFSLLTYQHTLVKHDDLSKVNLAFFTTNGFASIIFSAFVLIDLF